MIYANLRLYRMVDGDYWPFTYGVPTDDFLKAAVIVDAMDQALCMTKLFRLVCISLATSCETGSFHTNLASFEEQGFTKFIAEVTGGTVRSDN